MAKKRASKKKAAGGTTVIDVTPNEEMIVDLLLGEFMDLALKPLREMQMGWDALTEDIQQTKINDAERFARAKITQMVQLTASIEHPKLSAELVTTQIKPKEIVAKLSLARDDPQREQFFDFVSKKLVVVLVDPDDFLFDTDLPKADPDQRPLNGIE